MTVPFVDFAPMHGPIRAELDRALLGVIDAGAFILGPAVAEFERAFAGHCGSGHAVGVASGLDALTLALRGLGVGPGDEVITAANTFIATACAISATGARPVLVDCDPSSWCIDPALVEDALTPRTRAVVPVHLYGRLAAMDAVGEIARRRGLVVVEDAAQAHGARRGTVAAGAFGHAAGFSFYPAKNLGCFGDGGCVTTDDPELAQRIRLLGNYGQREKNVHEVAGGNSRLDTVQAAVLAVKLRHLDAWNESRRDAATAYGERLAKLPIELPSQPAERAEHVWHLYVIHVDDRDRVRSRLLEQGIQTGLHYPTPIHRQPAYAELGKGPGSFPVAERSAARLLTLPMFPGMSADQIDRVGSALERALG